MKLFISITISSFLLILYSCAYSPFSSSEYQSRNRLEYCVNIPDMNRDSILVSVRIPQWRCSDSVRLLAPPVYADNPHLIQTQNNFFLVSAINRSGGRISLSKDSCKVGIFNSLSLSFPTSELPATIEYYVKFQYEPHRYMPQPEIGEFSGYLQGNYLFLVPYRSCETVDVWRDSVFSMQVTYNLGSNVSLAGDPDSVIFKSPYQLMFSKSALFYAPAAGNQVLYSGEACGQPFRFVNISFSTPFPQDLIDKTVRDFVEIVKYLTPGFGTASDLPYTIITGMNDDIGLEGTFAFCLRNPKWDDTAAIAMTMAHEYVHLWIGILVGDYDDPWWKEGTTTYLGVLIPKVNNLCSYQYIRDGLVKDLSTVPHVDEYIISSPEVRALLYQGDLAPNIGTAVYVKGAQINMLLDRYIREASGNKTSLLDILAEFVYQFNGRAFHRNEYISFLNQRSGGDVQQIFSTYVDSPGIIPLSVLEENFDALAELGAFGEIDTLRCKDTVESASYKQHPFEFLWKNGM